MVRNMLEKIVNPAIQVLVPIMTELQSNPFNIIAITSLIISVFTIAYLLKKYSELANQIIDEKLTALNYLIPTLEQIIPFLPDKYKDEATLILDLLKEMKTINEAIKGTSTLRWYSLWKEYKKTLNLKLKLKHIVKG
ncbi:MAG: hypothetical protein QXV17_03245 [Candidatus Micrarchaeaceae archaeon]